MCINPSFAFLFWDKVNVPKPRWVTSAVSLFHRGALRGREAAARRAAGAGQKPRGRKGTTGTRAWPAREHSLERQTRVEVIKKQRRKWRRRRRKKTMKRRRRKKKRVMRVNQKQRKLATMKTIAVIRPVRNQVENQEKQQKSQMKM